MQVKTSSHVVLFVTVLLLFGAFSLSLTVLGRYVHSTRQLTAELTEYRAREQVYAERDRATKEELRKSFEESAARVERVQEQTNRATTTVENIREMLQVLEVEYCRLYDSYMQYCHDDDMEEIDDTARVDGAF